MSTAGQPPDRPESVHRTNSGLPQGRADAVCGLVANFYSLKTKKIVWKDGVRVGPIG